MKHFLRTLMFFLIIPLLILSVGVFLPTTPRASTSLLMSKTIKDSLLQNTPNPRIIFIGGSNLSFGLNSQMIKDSLKLNPINTAIHASIGIKFMIDNTQDYIQAGDLVVLVPEYNHFFQSINSGSEELMRTVFDVNLKNLKFLNIYQFSNIISYLPKFCLSKFRTTEYFTIESDGVYLVTSFNQYGDAYKHWVLDQKPFAAYNTIQGVFNEEVIKYFEKFNREVKNKGGKLLVTFPCFQDKSFNNSIKQIMKIEQELIKSKLTIIGSADRYKMPDSFMFNTPYHLNRAGVNERTKRIIEDIKKSEDERGL